MSSSSPLYPPLLKSPSSSNICDRRNGFVNFFYQQFRVFLRFPSSFIPSHPQSVTPSLSILSPWEPSTSSSTPSGGGGGGGQSTIMTGVSPLASDARTERRGSIRQTRPPLQRNKTGFSVASKEHSVKFKAIHVLYYFSSDFGISYCSLRCSNLFTLLIGLGDMVKREKVRAAQHLMFHIV